VSTLSLRPKRRGDTETGSSSTPSAESEGANLSKKKKRVETEPGVQTVNTSF
jgi:hypothetical protein